MRKGNEKTLNLYKEIKINCNDKILLIKLNTSKKNVTKFMSSFKIDFTISMYSGYEQRSSN